MVAATQEEKEDNAKKKEMRKKLVSASVKLKQKE
jgi:hypothetical protein